MTSARPIPQFDPKRIYLRFRSEIDDVVGNILAGGQYIGGQAVAQFEEHLADYLFPPGEACRVVSCANGTDALDLAFCAAGLQAGDEVLMPSHTYVAAVEMAVGRKLVPVWVDVQPDGYNMESDPEILFRHIGPRTKALVVVNMYGMPADWSRLQSFCREHRLLLIEDNAQGLGGSVAGKRLGSFGDLSTQSFFPTKPLGCMGDGGGIAGRNLDLMDRVASLARHGQGEKYHYLEVGRNSRLDALQAAILQFKLTCLLDCLDSTKAVAAFYAEALSGIEGLVLPQQYLREGEEASWHLYTVRVRGGRRDFLRERLLNEGIAAGLYYPQPLHRVPCYARHASEHSSRCRLTDLLHSEILSLPIFPFMEEREYARVADVVRRVFASNG